MAETLTVRVEGAASVNVAVNGVDLFTDAGLTTPATFPADITADTSWYADEPAVGARHFTVTITLPDGTVTMPNISFQALPQTIDALEGRASGVDGVPAGGASEQSLPTGVTGATVTQDNTWTTVGTYKIWQTTPDSNIAFAIGIDGDDFPRLTVISDGEIYFGDGTFDALQSSAPISYQSGVSLDVDHIEVSTLQVDSSPLKFGALSIHQTAATPSNAVGAAGDFALDKGSGRVWAKLGGAWVAVTPDHAGVWHGDLATSAGNLRIDGNLGVANAVDGTTPGTVVKSIEIFDNGGASLGFIPVYDAIT